MIVDEAKIEIDFSLTGKSSLISSADLGDNAALTRGEPMGEAIIVEKSVAMEGGS
jgi:hypothetical protein